MTTTSGEAAIAPEERGEYSKICGIIKQAADLNVEITDKRMRILLVMLHYLKQNPASFDAPSKNLFGRAELKRLAGQIEAYMRLVREDASSVTDMDCGISASEKVAIREQLEKELFTRRGETIEPRRKENALMHKAPMSTGVTGDTSKSGGAEICGGLVVSTNEGEPLSVHLPVKVSSGMPGDWRIWWINEKRRKRTRAEMLHPGCEPEPTLPETDQSSPVKLSRVFEAQRKLRREMIMKYLPIVRLEDNSWHLPPSVVERSTKSKRMSQRDRSRIEKEEKNSGNGKFLADMLQHRRSLLEHHRQLREFTRRTAFSCLEKLGAKKREEMGEADTDPMQRERMQALRSQDEEAYLRLLGESGNTRLARLIAQTTEFIERLGDRVLEQKKAAVAADDAVDDTVLENQLEHMEEEEELGSSKHSLIQAKERYFRLTHTVQEHLTEQPSILAGRGRKLRDYQLKGVEWLVSLFNNKLNGILADSMGLGKTVQTISLLAYLHEHKGIQGPHMIVAPLSTLRSNWEQEFERWLPSFKIVLYDGNKQQRKELRERFFQTASASSGTCSSSEAYMLPFQVLLTTDAYVLRDKQYLRKFAWEYLIVDEAHRLKNPKSKLVQVLNKQYITKRRLALTGTPLQNDIQEVWALLNFLMPSIFDNSDSFHNWFAGSEGSEASGEEIWESIGEEEKLLVVDRLHKVLRPFVLRRDKNEVEAQLPKKTEQIVWCEMTSSQKRMYTEIESRGLAHARGGSRKEDESPPEYISVGQNLQMQLRKVCNHPYLFCHDSDLPIDESLIRICGKMMALDGILPKLRATGHRVLIFSQMTKLLNILELYLTFRNFRYLRLDGSTGADDRERRIELFNSSNSNYFAFILSTRAGGLGINLQTADTVIIFDSDWNPQNDEQAQSRAHRLGQKSEVRTFRLITLNSVEEGMLQKAGEKMDQDALVIRHGMFNDRGNREAEAQRRDRLREALHNSGIEVDTIATDDYHLNQILARTPEEFDFYEAVDARREELGLRSPDLQLDSSTQTEKLPVDIILPPQLYGYSSSSRNKAWFGTMTDSEKAEKEKHINLWKQYYHEAFDGEWNIRSLARQRKRQLEGGEKRKSSGHVKASHDPVLSELKKRKHRLNHVVLKIAQDLMQNPAFADFYYAPTGTEYTQVVEKAIGLDDIRDLAGRRQYSSLHEVERHFARIAYNARLFNGTNHILAVRARNLAGAAMGAIRMSLSGSTTGKKSGNSKTLKVETPSPPETPDDDDERETAEANEEVCNPEDVDELTGCAGGLVPTRGGGKSILLWKELTCNEIRTKWKNLETRLLAQRGEHREHLSTPAEGTPSSTSPDDSVEEEEEEEEFAGEKRPVQPRVTPTTIEDESD